MHTLLVQERYLENWWFRVGRDSKGAAESHKEYQENLMPGDSGMKGKEQTVAEKSSYLIHFLGSLTYLLNLCCSCFLRILLAPSTVCFSPPCSVTEPCVCLSLCLCLSDSSFLTAVYITPFFLWTFVAICFLPPYHL